MKRPSITCCLDPACELRCPGRDLAREYHRERTAADDKLARTLRWRFLLIVLVAVAAASVRIFVGGYV